MAIDSTDGIGLPQPPTYFFMAAGTSEFDGQYDFCSKVARNKIKLVHKAGAEIIKKTEL